MDKVFDGNLAESQASEFNGDPALDIYAEEFVIGPNPSKKFRRIAVNSVLDDQFFDIDLADLDEINKGYDIEYGSDGVKITQTEFDGLKKAALFKLNFDYNLEDGYVFNGIVDGVSYRTASEPETWISYSILDIFNDIFVNHNNKATGGVPTGAPVFAAADIEFDEAELIAALGGAAPAGRRHRQHVTSALEDHPSPGSHERAQVGDDDWARAPSLERHQAGEHRDARLHTWKHPR